MADGKNFLIGRGETLIQPVELKSGGGEKTDPYSLTDALRRLTPQLGSTDKTVSLLPDGACPNDEAIFSITLHPSYLAKSYHPTNLLRNAGLRQVGSRERRIRPAVKIGRQKDLDYSIAPELFVAGSRQAISRFASSPESALDTQAAQYDFRKIEEISPLGDDRIRVGPNIDGEIPLEVVLHASGASQFGQNIIASFQEWLEECGEGQTLQRRQHAGGLSFLGIYFDAARLRDLAQFSFLRVMRKMPKLSLREVPFRTTPTKPVISVPRTLPEPIVDRTNVAIFDGGLHDNHPFGSSVVAYDAPGVGGALLSGLSHGTQVTSSLLFGPLVEGSSIEQPFSKIDHWRVIDDQDGDFDLMDTLDRIMDVLNQNEYEFVNLSLGPDEAMLDDDVHVWTSTLDQYASAGQSLIICAAGNNGEMDRASGLSRVQPASDGVNVLGVGSATCTSDSWKRALYSAVGPGRSPGLVKPDLIAFGGCDERPFYAITEHGKAEATQGTSFSAPFVGRMAAGLKALFTDQLSQTAVKALLIHHAEDNEHPQVEVGWGRVPSNIADLTECPDNVATVVYQGNLEPSRYRRFPLPYPMGGFEGRVTIRATFVTATSVDPEDSINYTKTGVGITFRPNTIGHPGFYEYKGQTIERSVHQSKSFFGSSLMFQTEQELRDDANRWESVVRNEKRFNAATLNQPVFDIEHLVRSHGQSAARSDNVSYALIVTISERRGSDLYDRVLRSYAGRLRPLQPRVELRT